MELRQVYLKPVKGASWRCTHFVTKRRTTLFFLQQLGTWFATRQVWIVGGKPTTSLFNSFCNNAAEQDGSFCCSFHSPFRPPTEWFIEVENSHFSRNEWTQLSLPSGRSRGWSLGMGWKKINKSLSTNHVMSHAFLKFLYRAWAL